MSSGNDAKNFGVIFEQHKSAKVKGQIHLCSTVTTTQDAQQKNVKTHNTKVIKIKIKHLTEKNILKGCSTNKDKGKK